MLEEANAYFDGTLSGNKWNEYSESDKEKALNEAQKTIDMLPVENVPNATVRAAVFEQALCLLARTPAELARLSMQLQGISSIKAGNASESYLGADGRSSLTGFMLCPKVEAMLLPYVPAVTAAPGKIIPTRRYW